MKNRLIVHPVMFAIFPFLFFYARNLQEFQALSAPVVFALLAFVLGLTALFWFVFNLVFKNPRKSALATSILVLIIFTYGHFYGFLEQTAPFVPGHAFLILAVLAGFGGCLYFIRRNQRNFGLTTFFLNTVSSVLIVINAFSVIAYEVSLMRLTPLPADSSVVLADDISYMPDIYLIILDEYAHSDTLEKHFDYDNSDFLTGLEERGFYIAEESTMHNEKSVRAIASILNMENTPEDEDRRISH